MYLSVIIPCYNEEELVVKVLDRLYSVFKESSIVEFEVIVIDDHSKDNSVRVVDSYKKDRDLNNLSLFRHEVNKGKGAAIQFGFEKSKGEYIIIQDADLELDSGDIPRMLEQLSDQVDFVNGSRYMSGVVRPLYAYKRYYMNKVFTRLASVLVDVRYTDLACGYKLFSRELLNEISLNENRFGIEAEMIIKASRITKNRIVEVPVHYYPRNKGEGKKIRNTDGIRILWVILKYGLFRMK